MPVRLVWSTPEGRGGTEIRDASLQWSVETVRFAPSPSGWLHLGHAYAAAFARDAADGGPVLLRIEDIDSDRVRPEYVDGIFEDLLWLRIAWRKPAVYQTERLGLYQRALARLVDAGAVYRCFCSRRQIAAEVAAADGAPHGLPPLYPGTCRTLPARESAERAQTGEPFAWRLDMAHACSALGALTWVDRTKGVQHVSAEVGDPVIARKDLCASYHLSATVDDAEMGITLVTRGEDLFAATGIHRVLQALLDLPVPEYDHHPLVGDNDGHALAKRDHSVALRSLRASGLSGEDALAMATGRLLQ